ncbi:MAG: hypothetical protein ACC630_03685 [Nitrospinota bacterium]
MRKQRIPDLISEIKDELSLIELLVIDIEKVNQEKPRSLRKRRVYEESLALKIHNFYTGCERIFQISPVFEAFDEWSDSEQK